MKLKIFIQKTIAGFLLLLFALGNMPQKMLHDIFAGHVDFSCKHQHKQTDFEIIKKSFSCDYNHFVAESPFTNTHFFLPNTPLFFHYTSKLACKKFVPLYFKHLFQLRAPPVKC